MLLLLAGLLAGLICGTGVWLCSDSHRLGLAVGISVAVTADVCLAATLIINANQLPCPGA